MTNTISGVYSLNKSEVSSINRREKQEIKKENFLKLKEELEKFSSEAQISIKLEDMEEQEKIFFFNTDVLVKASDLNDKLGIIREHLKLLNEINGKNIKKFEKIYNLFEELDKEYIKSIVGTIKAVELTTEELVGTQGELQKNTEELEKNTADIKEILEQQKILIANLVKQKEKLDRLEHLEDIDDIAERLYAWEEKIVVIKNLLNELGENIDENSREISRVEGELKEKLFSLENRAREIEKRFETDLNQQKEELNTKIKEQEESFSEKIKEQEKNFSDKLQELEEKQSSMNQELTQKIKNAYLLGGAVGLLAIIEFIIIFTKVL